jgi:hypothetical protein
MQNLAIGYQGLGVPIVAKRKSYKDKSIRWLVLFLSVTFMFGDFYVFDIPQTLEIQLEDRLKINSLYFNLLYSVTSLPNIFLPFFTGIFIGCIGIYTYNRN